MYRYSLRSEAGVEFPTLILRLFFAPYIGQCMKTSSGAAIITSSHADWVQRRWLSVSYQNCYDKFWTTCSAFRLASGIMLKQAYTQSVRERVCNGRRQLAVAVVGFSIADGVRLMYYLSNAAHCRIGILSPYNSVMYDSATWLPYEPTSMPCGNDSISAVLVAMIAFHCIVTWLLVLDFGRRRFRSTTVNTCCIPKT